MKSAAMYLLWLRGLFLLLLVIDNVTLGNDDIPIRSAGFDDGHLVTDSRDFQAVMKNRSKVLVYLDGDVELRNYYGWVFPTNSKTKPIGSNYTVEVSMFPSRYVAEGRPKVDMDGHSLHQLLLGRRRLTSQGLHYVHVHLPEQKELQSIGNSSVSLEHCVVEVFVKNHGNTIRSSVKYLRSLMQDPSALPYSAGSRVTDWWCDRNVGISCPYGAVVFYDAVIPWTENYRWHLRHTIIKFVPRQDAEIAISRAFLKAIQDGQDHIAIPFSLDLNFNVCKKGHIVRNTTIYDPRRSIPPSLIINFQGRLYGCVPVIGSPIIRVTDFILRNIFSVDAWPVMFPFVNAHQGATIVLENVIVEMDTKSRLSVGDLVRMAKILQTRKRAPGLGSGAQNISVWDAADCESYLTKWERCRKKRCPKEAMCPSGAIFIEDASFSIEKGDGNNDLGIGVHYHIRHSLITVIPPHGGHSNGTNPELVTERTADPGGKAIQINEDSSTRHALLVVFLVVIGVLCVFMVLCGYTSYKYGLFGKWTGSDDGQPTMFGTHFVAKAGVDRQPTFLTPEMPSGALAAKHADTSQTYQQAESQTYQQAASDLLGSVTLGSLLGAGSFGKVFKATWNGATVAVKVIVHDGINYRGTAAQREALLSSNLHHPNIVQTFMQTTREIKHDEHIPTMQNPKPGQASVTPTADPKPQQANNAADNGYLNLADMVPDEYRPEPPPKSIGSTSELSSNGRSFCGDRIETWLVQEFCDMGSLDKAIRKGKYVKGKQLNMVLVVDTCVDICRGMDYLKNRNVIHGDLKSSNILLNGSLHDQKGFSAKVADFGLSRELAMHASHVQTQTTGTVTHMPPELFKEERLTAASDVYSFGIVMWELVSKESPLEGVPHFLIIKKIVYDNWRPTFMDGVPECYTSLAQRCWAEDSQQRPTISEVLHELEEMKQHFLHPLSEQSL